MRKLIVLALFLLPGGLTAQTPDEIVNKYLAARGGHDKIKAVRSERITGTISFAPDAEGPFVVERERPLKLHMEITVNGSTMIRVFDGKSSGWLFNPFAENPSVQPMSETELRNIFDEADFEGPFVDYKEKGNQLESAGKTEVEGRPALKVKLTNKNGEVSYFSFDAVTFLVLQWQGTRKIGDKEIPWETYFRDFREIEGVKYPFVIESRSPETNDKQRIVADKIEVNIPIDAVRFAKPSPPSPLVPPAPANATKP